MSNLNTKSLRRQAERAVDRDEMVQISGTGALVLLDRLTRLEAAVREALGHLSAAVERIGSYPVGHHDVPSGRQNLHDGVQILKLALELKREANAPCGVAINKCHAMFEHTADWCVECEAEGQPCDKYIQLHGEARQAILQALAADPKHALAEPPVGE